MGQSGSGRADSPSVVSTATATVQSPSTDVHRPARPVPLASVIIATYNWSAALACAIRSVQRQTLQDFEIVVAGDACTDDSEAVVSACADPRITWTNLATNSGSQHAPNNAGLAIARGEWIAYLGHDDIWAPRHLESTIAAARAAASHAAAGGMIMYGPPGSGATSVAGIFADGRCSAEDFVPPSALVHRRDLIDQIGGWTDPRTLRLPTDCDFFKRVHAASPVASTREVSVFKFNAAARRNAYQAKSIVEQQACLAGLARGERFIAEELAKVLASIYAGRSNRIMLPDATALAPGEVFRANRIAKGVEHRFRPDELRSLAAAEQFGLEREPTGYEWHAVEENARFGAFRWTGPSERATIELPVRLGQPLTLRMHLLFAIDQRSLENLVVDAQGVPIETTLERTSAGTWLVNGVIEPSASATAPPYVQLTLRGLTAARPIDAGTGADTRRLGVAVNWVELAPLARSA